MSMCYENKYGFQLLSGWRSTWYANDMQMRLLRWSSRREVWNLTGGFSGRILWNDSSLVIESVPEELIRNYDANDMQMSSSFLLPFFYEPIRGAALYIERCWCFNISIISFDIRRSFQWNLQWVEWWASTSRVPHLHMTAHWYANEFGESIWLLR